MINDPETDNSNITISIRAFRPSDFGGPGGEGEDGDFDKTERIQLYTQRAVRHSDLFSESSNKPKTR